MRCESGPSLEGIRERVLDEIKDTLRQAVIDEAAGILATPLSPEERAAACACLRTLETETCPKRMRAIGKARLEALNAKIRRRPGP